ncbi:MAG: PspC family transcriptional regulator [Chitinophagales bacterium]|nr:PspC family transcriptional regulator [Chitinophagales bacterium]
MAGILRPVEKVRDIIEMSIFGGCSWLGTRLRMPSKKIRLFFVYASFLAVGSPVIIYLILVFLLNLRYMIKGKRNPVWDI